MHVVLLRALREHGLLKGWHQGIDSRVIEANASLRKLQHRNSEQSYRDHVKTLVKAAGVDPEDAKVVRRFDKKRAGRKASNQEWGNPHDPEAKVGRTKNGAIEMIYKLEHVTDLESCAIVDVGVRPGDAADSDAQMVDRLLAAVGVQAEVAPEGDGAKLGTAIVADEGYFALGQITSLQSYGGRTVIADPLTGRRRKAARTTGSASGKALLRKRGEHRGRRFAHVLDHGGLRRATLKGCENLTKRHDAAALSFNLSLLLRHVLGTVPPNNVARRMGRPFAVVGIIVGVLAVKLKSNSRPKCIRSPHRTFDPRTSKPLRLRFVPGISTGC